MKLVTIALAGALAMSSTLALAQMGGGNGEGATLPENSARGYGTHGYDAQGNAAGQTDMDHRTTGMGRGPKYSTVPGGDPAGRSSLSGSGPSTFGGNSPSVIK